MSGAGVSSPQEDFVGGGGCGSADICIAIFPGEGRRDRGPQNIALGHDQSDISALRQLLEDKKQDALHLRAAAERQIADAPWDECLAHPTEELLHELQVPRLAIIS